MMTEVIIQILYIWIINYLFKTPTICSVRSGFFYGFWYFFFKCKNRWSKVDIFEIIAVPLSLEMCGKHIAGLGGLPFISLDSFYPCCSFPLLFRKPKETSPIIFAPCPGLIMTFVNNTRMNHDCCQSHFPRGSCFTHARALAPQLMRNTLLWWFPRKDPWL